MYIGIELLSSGHFIRKNSSSAEQPVGHVRSEQITKAVTWEYTIYSGSELLIKKVSILK